MQRAIKHLKRLPEPQVMSTLPLTPTRIWTHGIVSNQSILNDETVDVLAEMALSHAKAELIWSHPLT